MADADITVTPELDQEEVARVMARYNLPSVAVVDEGGRLLGRVTFDDVIDVVEAETTEDLLKFGGVSPDEDAGRGVGRGGPEPAALALRQPRHRVPRGRRRVRLPGHGAARRSTLAVWMPIIAGMGGNAGTQALAVTVRRLALGLIPATSFVEWSGRRYWSA